MTTIDGGRAIVTGPTSGLGKEIARRLTECGAEVVLACRDGERGRQTAQEIAASTSRTEPAVMVVVTSSQRSIRRFAAEYRERYGVLDVLVNNAGVLRPEREIGVDGYESTFSTNVLGYHLLTRELADALRRSTSAGWSTWHRRTRATSTSTTCSSSVARTTGCAPTRSPRPATGC